MRRCCLVLFVLAMFTTPALGLTERGAERKAARGEVKVEWLFDIKMDKDDNPTGKVYLLVGGRKILIRPQAIGQYHVLERTEYKSSDVPASAVAACSAWWAGSGEDMYVLRRKNQLVVFIRYLDEGVDVSAYRRLKVIRLP